MFLVSRLADNYPAELRMRDLLTDQEQTLRLSDVNKGERRDFARISDDGQHVVFRYIAPRAGDLPLGHITAPQQLRLLDLKTNEESALTDVTDAVSHALPSGWSHDGQYVVAALLQRTGMAIGLLPVAAAPDAAGRVKLVTTFTGDGGLWQPSMAPNGRWIAFGAGGRSPRIAVVGSSDGSWNGTQDETAWRSIEEPAHCSDPRWSSDGRLLYFVANREGVRNVWAVDFDPESGTMGSPFRVTAFNGIGERMSSELALASSTGKLGLRTSKPTGGIWLLHQP